MPKCCECQGNYNNITIQRHPTKTEGWIEKKVRKNEEIERNGEKALISSFSTERVRQVPALICEGCLQDINDKPDASPIFVTNSSHLEK